MIDQRKLKSITAISLHTRKPNAVVTGQRYAQNTTLYPRRARGAAGQPAAEREGERLQRGRAEAADRWRVGTNP